MKAESALLGWLTHAQKQTLLGSIVYTARWGAIIPHHILHSDDGSVIVHCVMIMWHYLWPHVIYHSSFFLLRRKRLLIVVIGLLALLLVGPQLWVMNIYDYYIMYCPLPIYQLMLASLLLSLCSLCFSVFFLTQDHLSRMSRCLFHSFGVADVVFETAFIYYTYRASACVVTAKEMYIICCILSIFAVLSTVLKEFPKPPADCTGNRINMWPGREAYFVCLSPIWMCTNWTGENRQAARRDCTESVRHCTKSISTSPYIWPV